MLIISHKIHLSDLPALEDKMFYNDFEMVKAVADPEAGKKQGDYR